MALFRDDYIVRCDIANKSNTVLGDILVNKNKNYSIKNNIAFICEDCKNKYSIKLNNNNNKCPKCRGKNDKAKKE